MRLEQRNSFVIGEQSQRQRKAPGGRARNLYEQAFSGASEAGSPPEPTTHGDLSGACTRSEPAVKFCIESSAWRRSRKLTSGPVWPS